ncbi:hypothetical protein T552_02937 [Pneumocystis carinii B80]|uniref:Glycerol uptake protein 1 n=1 Tax=Pneumocystis carinii (strain B80) TaxID=1408658 RepID=A0A0W4ZDR0_PNEC8|nr:hypothetical protein T552_02937 [Pneumocystis carinii B80]KTW26458.1 hypothetical protein T552_02937 [Pneumocystis carinii B80]
MLSLFSLRTSEKMHQSEDDSNFHMDDKEILYTKKSKELESKWMSYEFFIYYWVIFFVAIFSLKTTYDISNSSHHNYAQFSKNLRPGWIGKRKMDNTDIQYAVFRRNVPVLIVTSAIHLSLGSLSNYVIKHFKILNDVQRRILYNNIFSFIFLIILHGTGIIKIYIIAYINYSISRIFSKSKLNPILTWFFNVGILFLNDIYKGYLFGSFYHKLSFLDRYNGFVPRWQIYFNTTILRFISYNLDYYWSQNDDASELSDFQLTEKNRINIPCFREDYCLLNFFSYAFYSPLYFSGPIISFNNFISQLRYPSKDITISSIIKYLLRLLFCFFLLELILHFFYVVAISKIKSWKDYSPSQISMIGYLNLQIVWLKLLFIWRFFRLWTLCDKIDPPENIVRCINNNYSFLGFWRAWHRSFNRWIIRYIYLPLGGSKFLVPNIFVIFTFVALWHDITLRLFVWGWLITLFILPEIIACRIFQSKKWEDWPYYRHLCALGATFNIIMMMIANLVGFCLGIQGTKDLFIRIFIDYKNFFFLITLFFTLFAASQIMFEIRNHEKRNGIFMRY